MRLQTKALALSAILIADLLFFLFFKGYYPELFETIFQWLPWQDSLEKMVTVTAGLAIAVLSSTAIISLVISSFKNHEAVNGE